jgi:hypothetical protein
LLKASGCIGFWWSRSSSDRLLKLIDKGVTVEQVAKVTCNFTEAGMVHCYLMYGYPTQTVQETGQSGDGASIVSGVLQSGFWHQFAMTAHSPVGIHPEKFGVIKKTEAIGTFANNDIDYIDSTGIDHNKFSFDLRNLYLISCTESVSTMNCRSGLNLKFRRLKFRRLYLNALEVADDFNIKSAAKIVWLGGKPSVEYFTKSKKETPGI